MASPPSRDADADARDAAEQRRGAGLELRAACRRSRSRAGARRRSARARALLVEHARHVGEEHSSSAASAVAMAAAASSAFTLSIVPGVASERCDDRHAAAASAGRCSAGARAERLADEAERRDAAHVDAPSPSATRVRPAARSAPQSSAETAARPSRTQASIGSSVTRRPPTKCGSTPRSRASALICGAAAVHDADARLRAPCARRRARRRAPRCRPA